jgi:S-DNA-T family DNA segregation ATPase FtsK/SpoIIIE
LNRRKKASARSQPSPAFGGFCLFAVALLGLYCTLFPHDAGVLGMKIARATLRAFGWGSYVFWGVLGYRGLRLILHQENRRPWRYILIDILLISAFCSLLSSLGPILVDQNYGGLIGKGIINFLTTLFGRWGALFLSCAFMAGVSFWRMNRHPGELLLWVWNRLKLDWQEWRQAAAAHAAKEAAEKPAPIQKSLPKVSNKPAPVIPTPAVAAPSMFDFKPSISKPQVAIPAAKKETAAEKADVNASKPMQQSLPYVLPPLELLTVPERSPVQTKEEDLLASAQHLEKTLAEFGVQGKVVEIHPGPIITRFDYTPAPGIKVQAVANLSNDIAMAMKALSVRIQAPIPGKNAVGIELPNPKRVTVRLREIFESEAFQKHPSKLALGLGKDGEGHPQIADLATMPHLLIAGSTGSGKSVCIHALVMSLLYRATPQEVKILMIDPKRVELPLYNGIPYLFDPNQNPENVRVITDVKEAAKALDGMVKIMDNRFKKLASVMARDISEYNEKMLAEGSPIEPFIVVIIDELADMMAAAPKEVETSIQRLSQMARAVGIHLVLATQRPSVDVITGVIKANLPARIAFRVASQTDSRVILDTSGAESLLGQGDMLFSPAGAPKPIRVQCGLVTNEEVKVVSDHARLQGKPSYERILTPISSAGAGHSDLHVRENLDDIQQALMLVVERRRVSQDLLKAHFGSSARATDLLSQLEVKGFIAKPEGTNRWTIYFDRIDTYLGSVHQQSTTPR